MIKINKGTSPAYLLSSTISTAINTVKSTYDGNPTFYQNNSLDITSLYNHKDVKDQLIKLQHGKCCFCEARIVHISYGDVEHFRPKKGYQQDEKDPLHHPGYYWLAFDWENLFLSCQLCNQREKKNFFPLTDPSSRAKCHHDNINNESPLFINPSVEDPQDFITFIGEVPSPISGNSRAKETIIRLKLDRVELNEDRLEYLDNIRDIEIWFLKYLQNIKDVDEIVQAGNEFKDILLKHIKPEASYSSMVEANFKKYL